MTRPTAGWWQRRSLRWRLMLIGLLGLAIVQAVSSVALYVALSILGTLGGIALGLALMRR